MKSEIFQNKLSMYLFRIINYLAYIWSSFIIKLCWNVINFAVHVLSNITRSNSTIATRKDFILETISIIMKVFVSSISQRRQINWLYIIIGILMLHVIINYQNLIEHLMTVLNLIIAFIVCLNSCNHSSSISYNTSYYDITYYNKNNNIITNKQTTKEMESYQTLDNNNMSNTINDMDINFINILIEAPSQELDHFTIITHKLLQNELSIYLFRVINKLDFIWLSFIIMNSIVIIYPVKLFMFCTLAKGLLICLIHYTLRELLSTLNQPSFFMFIALQNTATKLKSRIYLTHYQTRILLNIICTFISFYIGSILFRINANKLCAENTIAAFLYLGNDGTHLASFIAIGFLLFVRYFILRAILLTSIQLLFVFVANSGLVNVYEIIARTIQREILLVNSSNNNTNCGHDTVFGLLNPSPQKMNYVFAFLNKNELSYKLGVRETLISAIIL